MREQSLIHSTNIQAQRFMLDPYINMAVRYLNFHDSKKC